MNLHNSPISSGTMRATNTAARGTSLPIQAPILTLPQTLAPTLALLRILALTLVLTLVLALTSSE